MRIWVIPAVVAGALTGAPSDEPSEYQMRIAFERALARQVSNALEFVSQSGGQEAVAEIRTKGNDRFSVNSFRKLQCRRGESGHICGFRVDIALVNGDMIRTLSGQFSGETGFTFTDDI